MRRRETQACGIAYILAALVLLALLFLLLVLLFLLLELLLVQSVLKGLFREVVDALVGS